MIPQEKRKKTMSARTKRIKQEKTPAPPAKQGWIAPKNGIRIIAVVSILLAVWEGYQVSQFRGTLESIMWGLIFGATIWLIAGFAYFFTRWIRRG
jgi:hypothetical protein